MSESGHLLHTGSEADMVNQLILQFLQKVDTLAQRSAL